MASFWKWLDHKNMKAVQKFRTALLLLSVIAGIFGFFVWNVVRAVALGTIEWMIIFIGYSVVMAWLYTVLHAYRHDLHDGSATSFVSGAKGKRSRVLRPREVQ